MESVSQGLVSQLQDEINNIIVKFIRNLTITLEEELYGSLVVNDIIFDEDDEIYKGKKMFTLNLAVPSIEVDDGLNISISNYVDGGLDYSKLFYKAINEYITNHPDDNPVKILSNIMDDLFGVIHDTADKLKIKRDDLYEYNDFAEDEINDDK